MGGSLGCHFTFEEREADNRSRAAPEFKRSGAGALVHVEAEPRRERREAGRTDGEQIADKQRLHLHGRRETPFQRLAENNDLFSPTALSCFFFPSEMLNPHVDSAECVFQDISSTRKHVVRGDGSFTHFHHSGPTEQPRLQLLMVNV